MEKIVFLPLDERPCNNMFPKYLYKDYLNLVMPSENILGDNKKEANVDKLIEFIFSECKNADALVLSLDMLVYGGLVPSRIHHLEKEILEDRLSILKKVKEINPKIKIYGFVLIMRCPDYSSDDEEPTYYERCGREIHKLGSLIHKEKLGLDVDKNEIERLKDFITTNDLNDYLNRREKNLEIVKKAIEFRMNGIIDHLVIPQDDSAPYGYTAMDQGIVRDKIEKCHLSSDILMYPGADEAGLSVLSRCILNYKNIKPKVYIKYASEGGYSIIPSYEDRPLGETAKYHIISAGGRVVSSYAEADCVLCFTNPSKGTGESRWQKNRTIEADCFRNIPELIDFIKDAIIDKKPVLLADNACANGGELSLLNILNSNNLLDKLASYAGWNTNANTLGTVLAQGFLYLLNGPSKAHFDFLALRYLEDLGYCSSVRFDCVDNEIEKYGFNYFYVKDKRGIVSNIVREKLEKFKDEYLSSIANDVVIKDVYMPWRRMFEVGIVVEWNHK